jgi:hypothetical protein
LGAERPAEYRARYRDWFEANRAAVHEASHGRLGFRWNGGGNVSGLLLKKLARRRVGYSFTRWSPPEKYPNDSLRPAAAERLPPFLTERLLGAHVRLPGQGCRPTDELGGDRSI